MGLKCQKPSLSDVAQKYSYFFRYKQNLSPSNRDRTRTSTEFFGNFSITDFQLQFPNVSTSVREELNVKLRDKEQRQLQAIYLAATGSFQGEGGQNIVGTLTERVNTLVADLLSDSDAKFKILPTIN